MSTIYPFKSFKSIFKNSEFIFELKQGLHLKKYLLLFLIHHFPKARQNHMDHQRPSYILYLSISAQPCVAWLSLSGISQQ